MASILTVKLTKGDSPSWGFRLQGGKDFGTPLIIQKVIVGSPAERAGLVAGDSVIRVNNTDVFNLRHKDAQDVLLRAGFSFDMTIQRGGSTWKPSVILTGPVHTPSPVINNISPVTRTSLAAKPSENIGAIGTGHNVSAKPFVNGAVNGGPKVVNNQYNSPLKLYSEESIAETLSAQTEVLSTGALGVNFKKNERNYDASKSAVLSLLKEEESSSGSHEHIEQHHQVSSGIDTAASPVGIAGLRHVTAPENKPQPPSPQLPPGQNICADCERLIVGVFVRIKDKNLHVECFKCSTCGTSLKNVGYYNINNKLYCDVHAKLAARNNPPAPNLVPITIPPGGKAPAHAISAALSSHPYPTSAPLSPRINSYQNQNTLPKTFGSVPGPLSPSANFNSLPRTGAPLSPVAPILAPISTPSFSPVSSTAPSVSNIVWPPVQEEPELPSACPLFYPPPSQVIIKPRSHKDSENSEQSEVERINTAEEIPRRFYEMQSSGRQRSATECVETIGETLQRQMLVETVIKSRPQSPPPPEIPKIIPQYERAQPLESNVQESVASSFVTEERNIIKSECKLEKSIEIKNIERQSTTSKIVNPVPKKWESQMLQALTITANENDATKDIEMSNTLVDESMRDQSENEKPLSENDNTFSSIPAKKTTTALGSALSVAPVEPFNPVKPSLLEAIPLPEETIPYMPPDDLFVVPLRSVENSEKPPRGRKKKDSDMEKLLEDLPKPQGKLSMLAALTTASDRPFTPVSTQECEISVTESNIQESKKEDQTKMMELTESKRPTNFPQTLRIQSEADKTPSSPECLPLFQGFTCSFQNKTDHSQFDIQISTTPPLRRKKSKKQDSDAKEKLQTDEVISEEKQKIESVCTMRKEENKSIEMSRQETHKNVVFKKPEQMISLHKPEALPQYQKAVKDNAEADIIMMERMERAKNKQEQKKQEVKHYQSTEIAGDSRASCSIKAMSQQTQSQDGKYEKPISIPPECPSIQVLHSPENSFKPVIDSRPQSCTIQSRPLTPSMISKPPPMIPYYQANLVAQKHCPPTINFLDPKSPAISRSPSPLPERSRTPQIHGTKSSNIRPRTPAQGPPSNPLISEHIPTRDDFKLREAKDNLTTYIPQHKEKLETLTSTGRDSRNSQRSDMYISDVVTTRETAPIITTEMGTKFQEERIITKDKDVLCKMQESKIRQTADSEKERTESHVKDTSESTTKISEKLHLEKSDDFKKTEDKSIEKSSDGSIQIQRRKIVTEEMEHTQKSMEVTIEKNTRTIPKHGFRDVKTHIDDDRNIVGMHVTAPHPIRSPFLKSAEPTIPPKLNTVCQKVGKEVECKKTECCQQEQAQQVPIVPKFDATTLPRPKCIPEIPPESPVEKTPPKAIKHVDAPGSSKSNQKLNPNVPPSDVGAGGGRQIGAVGVSPKRGRGVLNTAQLGGRIPLCGQCHGQIRGPFITALGKIWCPNHFICNTPSCRRPLHELGFVEEQGQLYCEYCFEQYLAPNCSKCGSKIKGDCLKAIGKVFHPECFSCVHCGKLFGNSPFFLEDGSPYCETDWNEFFTTKCFACGFPVEAGDRWVEALNNNYHSQCFNCTMCKKNLEGQSFFAKGGRPYCKNHAR